MVPEQIGSSGLSRWSEQLYYPTLQQQFLAASGCHILTKLCNTRWLQLMSRSISQARAKAKRQNVYPPPPHHRGLNGGVNRMMEEKRNLTKVFQYPVN